MREEVIATQKAAALLGVHPRTVRRWLGRGLLRGYRDRATGRLFVVLCDVQELLPERRLQPVEVREGKR